MPRRGCSAGAFDEAFDRTGSPRPPYAKALAALAEHDLRELERRMRLAVRGRGVVFGGAAGEREFALDPVPRVFEAAEWSELERGLAQRVRALDAFCADAHGERR
ncbi:MAG TPA: circularly permuted type 2 ATP-grasp protein, partial [Solirubrobacteraceae bacterium]|nr:circularly permuted type 2 ATP-grasp protein [Solirubrobacteraceae bacterium]